MSSVYQRGSIRRIKRARDNEAWEWRYRVNGVMRQQTFPVSKFPSEKKLWAHLETSVGLLNSGSSGPLPVAVTMGAVIKRYRKEYLPELSSRSARDTYEGALKLYIEPKWSKVAIADVKAMDVDKWLKSISLGQASKARLRGLMKRLIDRAVFWEMIPDTWPNPIRLVTVKHAMKRQKKIAPLKAEQVSKLIAVLPEPYSIMVLIAASLGLRVEEIGALQWDDFDFEEKTVYIQRAWTHGEIKETKTPSSEATLPVPDVLITSLKRYRPIALAVRNKKSKWLFPSSRRSDEKPRWMGVVMQDHIQPKAKELGLPHLGWHVFRHAYRSWIGSGEATVSEQKDMMRHSSIHQTMEYGGTPVEEMRPHVNAIADRLAAAQKTTAQQRGNT